MIILRNLLFKLLFYGASVFIVLFAPVAALFGTRALRSYCVAWGAYMGWCARVSLGVQVKVEGDIPPGPVLFAAKHESFFEAIDLTQRIGSPAPVLKRELTKIPGWGWAVQRFGGIVADREANATALRSMMRDAKVVLAERRSILIFPEGTRALPGQRPPLRSGFAGLYRMLRIPVVPIAVKSGHVWPRDGLMRPGTVHYHFGEPIEPGLSREELEARVHAAINRFDEG